MYGKLFCTKRIDRDIFFQEVFDIKSHLNAGCGKPIYIVVIFQAKRRAVESIRQPAGNAL